MYEIIGNYHFNSLGEHLNMEQTTEQELRDRLQIPADYDPNSDGGNLLGRLYDTADETTQRHLFKRMAWTLINRETKVGG